MVPDDPTFAFSVEQELDKAAALLARGLAGQRAPHYTDTARFLILVDLVGGLRSLLVVARSLLCPDPTPAASLTELLDSVLAVFPVRVWRTDEGERIYHFLRGDPLLRNVLGVLDAFERARAGTALVWPGEGQRPASAEFAWRQVEQSVAERLFPEEEERLRRRRSPEPAAYQQPVNDEVIRVLTQAVDDLFTVLARSCGLKGSQAWPARWRQLVAHGRA